MNTQDRSAVLRRSVLILAIASLLVLSGGASFLRLPETLVDRATTAPADGLTKLFAGQIAGVEGDMLMIVNAAGEDHRLRVAEDATIMLNDTEASLDSLSGGLHATVMAESRGANGLRLASMPDTSIRLEQGVAMEALLVAASQPILLSINVRNRNYAEQIATERPSS